jgi:hypothetical protein
LACLRVEQFRHDSLFEAKYCFPSIAINVWLPRLVNDGKTSARSTAARTSSNNP